jgi:hypothetical protein
LTCPPPPRCTPLPWLTCSALDRAQRHRLQAGGSLVAEIPDPYDRLIRTTSSRVRKQSFTDTETLDVVAVRYRGRRVVTQRICAT